MDRLLCGDVGYGKTEVAMRAAFKAVSDGKQVAVLAPTTVLAFQHYETFRRRLAAFPVDSRDAQPLPHRRRSRKKPSPPVEAGKVDILIGTHRLLSKDVKFHDLGLLVVDEEQRFGVAHKERLKQMTPQRGRADLDRHAHPAHAAHVAGRTARHERHRDAAQGPPGHPDGRRAVLRHADRVAPSTRSSTAAARSSSCTIASQSIYSLAAWCRNWCPRRASSSATARWASASSERVMLAFVRDEADVLVSTTIVENGLDIPRANTIIINRADRFGLSELYQLRGRVGRSNRRAYAYLLVPPGGQVTPLAQRRLAALREFSDLGAGFRIAALDLELRGAGNLLGGEQHGHIDAVGFDLYCQMLERAVAAKKGEAAGARAPRHAQPRSRYPHSAGVHLRGSLAPARLQAHRRRVLGSRSRCGAGGAGRSLRPPAAVGRKSARVRGPQIRLRAAADLLRRAPGRRSCLQVSFHHARESQNLWCGSCAGSKARAWIPAACWPWPSKAARPASPARSETYCVTSKQGTKMRFRSGIGLAR